VYILYRCPLTIPYIVIIFTENIINFFTFSVSVSRYVHILAHLQQQMNKKSHLSVVF